MHMESSPTRRSAAERTVCFILCVNAQWFGPRVKGVVYLYVCTEGVGVHHKRAAGSVDGLGFGR